MRDRIKFILRCYQKNHVDLTEATDSLLRMYDNSKRFQFFSFQIGALVGAVIVKIVYYFL